MVLKRVPFFGLLKFEFAIFGVSVSRATVVALASVVRKLRFFRHYCMDPDQLLWEAT